MRKITAEKMALAVSLVAMTILLFGSLLTGARFLTAFIRGLEGAFLLGIVAWGLGRMLLVEEKDDEEDMEQAKKKNKGNHLDQTA